MELGFFQSPKPRLHGGLGSYLHIFLIHLKVGIFLHENHEKCMKPKPSTKDRKSPWPEIHLSSVFFEMKGI